MRNYLLLLSILFLIGPAAHAKLRLVPKVEPRNENLEILLDSALSYLPHEMKSALDREITVIFGNTTDFEFIPPGLFDPTCTSPALNSDNLVKFERGFPYFGFGAVHTIVLNPTLVTLIEGGEAKTPCRHNTVQEFLISPILYAISVLYDEEVGVTFRSRLKHTLEFYNPSTGGSSIIPVQTAGLVFHFDPRELQNRWVDGHIQALRHQFGVLMEYYLLDYKFSCKRPGVASVLLRYFPANAMPCQSQLVLNLDPPINADGVPLPAADGKMQLIIDPTRIYQLEYVFEQDPDASIYNGNKISAFGHGNIRIVMCKPFEKKGEHCREDGSDDILMSFQPTSTNGDVADEPILEGFVGSSLRAQLRLERFDLNREYDQKIMNRQYTSYRLLLNKQEQINALMLAIELRDLYYGPWHHGGNNCVVNVYRFLRAIMSEDRDLGYWVAAKTVPPNMPSGLLVRFREFSLVY